MEFNKVINCQEDYCYVVLLRPQIDSDGWVFVQAVDGATNEVAVTGDCLQAHRYPSVREARIVAKKLGSDTLESAVGCLTSYTSHKVVRYY